MIGERGEHLVYLLGVPRSGTTLLGAMLSNHANILCPQEPWLMLALHALGKTNPRHPADAQLLGEATSQFMDHDTFIEAARQCAAAAYNMKLADAGCEVFIDKTPRYYHILPFIDEVFPEAKYIWLKRDPFDVANSYKTSWGVDLPKLIAGQSGTPFEHDLVLGYRRLSEFAAARPERVFQIAYESLVRSPTDSTDQIISFLGLPGGEPLEQLARAVESLRESKLGDRKILHTTGVHTQSIGAAMGLMSAGDLQVIYDAIGPRLLRDLGYAAQIDVLHARGVSDPEEETTRLHEQSAHDSLTARWDAINLWSSVDALPTAIELQNELISRMKTQTTVLEAQIMALQGSLVEMQASLAERDSHIAGVEAHLASIESQFEQYRQQYKRLSTKQHLRLGIKGAAFGVLNRMCRPPSGYPLPTISIVTPVFNGAAHIRETIESVLAQAYPNLEYIIVDGGSTDGTMDIVREYQHRITRVISEPDDGMYDAAAKGFEIATGEVLGYLNADDLFEPGGLMRVGEFFRDHPKAMVAYREDTITAQGWRFPNAHQPHVDMFDLLRGHILFQDGVHFRRAAYQAVRGLNRELRLAGDFDLWLRLARPFKLHRAPGHVSSFRIRPGQLSGNMPPYHEEQKRSQQSMLATMRLRTYIKRTPRYVWNRMRNAWEKLRGRRLFYPMNFAGPLAPGVEPDSHAAPPKCPLTGRPPDRLLFTSRDTRFGHPLINSVYYCDASHVAVVWPPLSETELTALYEKHYSGGSGDVIHPPEGLTSPYRGYKQPRRWRRLFKRARWPMLAARIINHPRERGGWNEVCMRDLLGALPRRFRISDTNIRLLDVGCFEAGLLDTARQRTTWQTCGIEPNAAAVNVAREKGHKVWHCGAEDAPFVVPASQQFDIIYLGQTIEHFNDPLRVVRCLATMLAPRGVIVLTTPNLDSRQVDFFGPTWAHWHVPYHRYLFGRRSLRRLCELAGLRQARCRSHSHSYWTAYSVQLNQLGVAGAVSHMWTPTPEVLKVSRSLAAWSRLLWNWRGRGDYLVAVFEAARNGVQR